MITTQDFVKGVDMTGIDPANAGDFNNLVDLATVATGHSIGLISNDTALDTPDVPDANTTLKWKQYTWLRRPHSSSTEQRIKAYNWNDNAASDPTFLKWLERDSNTAELEALTSIANNALSTAQSAVTTADLASSQANTAANDATAAITSATNANNTANTSLTNANAAVVTANASAAAANTATIVANAALNAATTGDVAIARILTSDNAGKVPETSADGTRLTLIDRDSKIAQFQQVSAGDGGDSTGSFDLRLLNQTIKAATWATLTGASRVTLTTGKYWIDGWAIGYGVNHQAVIRNNTTNVYALRGASIYGTAVNINTTSRVTGYITISAATEDIELLDFTGAGLSKGLGRATGLLEGEIFADITVYRLN